MATRLSSNFRRIALRLVERFGKDGYYIRREVRDEPDAEHPTRPVKVETVDYPCKAALAQYEERQIDGIQVLRSDRMAVVAWTEGLPEDIIPGDMFVDGEVVYKIVPNEQPLAVNGELVAYILQIRK